MSHFQSRSAPPYVGVRCRLLILLGLLLTFSLCSAAGFTVLNAATQLENNVYRLSATIDYDFSSEVDEALNNGVPLTLQLEIEIRRQRNWLWDETVAGIQQRYRLEYHALSRQYLVTNLNNGELNSFPSRYSALEAIGTLRHFPLLDNSLVKGKGALYGRMRALLDIEELPAPLRPVAYLSASWRLSSEWYIWPL